MSTHAALAESNHRLALSTDLPADFPREWRITLHFYAAVHAVNHVLFPDAFAPEKFRHEHRRLDMQKHQTLRTVARTYGLLEDLATVARYLPARHPMTEAQVQSAKVWSTEILKRAGLAP